MSVHTLDCASMLWEKLEPTGTPPMSRGGHTATVVGGKLWVFGGEGADRRLKNDTHCLDLEVRVSCMHAAATSPNTVARHRCAVGGVRPEGWGEFRMTSTLPGPRPHMEPTCFHSRAHERAKRHWKGWLSSTFLQFRTALLVHVLVSFHVLRLHVRQGPSSQITCLTRAGVFGVLAQTMEWSMVVTSGVIPEPRARHVACAVGDQYLLVFGGGSTARCRGGLALLDTRTGEWAAPACEGAMPAARSGAAAAVLGGCWYISGGGDHKRAMTDTLVLEARPIHAPTIAGKPSADAV
jgi:hypothetical protein